MGYSWAFVGEFMAKGEVLKDLQRLLPAQQSELAHIRDDGSLHDRVYSKTGLSIRRLADGDEYKELLADVRKTLAKIAKAGASGAADLVSFDDGAKRKGVHFEIRSGKVKETEAADSVRKSKPYRALVARHAKAFDDDDESGNDVVNVAVREAILGRIDQLSDETLLAAARATKLTISTGPTDVPPLERYARPSNLRKALVKGGKDWCDRINDAPLLILAVVDTRASLLFARRIIDEGTDRFDPLKTSALSVLARSPGDEDFERVWRIFEKERAQPLG